MKVVLFALLVWASAPAILAEDEKSLRDLIGDKADPSPHIMGGDEAKPGAYPHQAYVRILRPAQLPISCGGSLIHRRWVLTAAHCVESVREVTVFLGVHDFLQRKTPPTQSFQVVKIFIDENYKKNSTDIALLKLEKAAKLTKFVQTIRLPAKSLKRKNLAGVRAEVIGWGTVTHANGAFSPVLRVAPNKVISNNKCKKMGARNVTEWRICSQRTKGKGTCNGDSGGPLLMTEKDKKRTVIGIISYGSRNCTTGTPDVFTRVDHWLEWINKLTRIPLRD